MSYFAAVMARADEHWSGQEVSLAGCESLADVGDVLREAPADVRVLVIEQDDEYAAIVRLDDEQDDPRAFVSDAHAADAYPMASVIAEQLDEIGATDEAEDDEIADLGGADEILVGAPPGHDSAPCGDPDIVEDLGTCAADLLAMCASPGTLPVDLLVVVCEKAGCGQLFEGLRG